MCFNVDLEDLSVHGSVDDPGRDEAVAAQTGDEGLCLPGPKGRFCAVTLPARRPACSFGELGISGGFIDKNQPGQGPIEERSAPRDPQVAVTGNINAPTFAGLQTFFYD